MHSPAFLGAVAQSGVSAAPPSFESVGGMNVYRSGETTTTGSNYIPWNAQHGNWGVFATTPHTLGSTAITIPAGMNFARVVISLYATNSKFAGDWYALRKNGADQYVYVNYGQYYCPIYHRHIIPVAEGDILQMIVTTNSRTWQNAVYSCYLDIEGLLVP